MPGADFACCRLVHGEADQMPGRRWTATAESRPYRLPALHGLSRILFHVPLWMFAEMGKIVPAFSAMTLPSYTGRAGVAGTGPGISVPESL